MESKKLRRYVSKPVVAIAAVVLTCLTVVLVAMSQTDPAVYWNPSTVISDASGTIIVPAGSDANDGLSEQTPVASMNKVLSVASSNSIDQVYMISTNTVSLGAMTIDGRNLNFKRYDGYDTIADFTAPFFSVGADNPFTTTLKNMNLKNNIAGNSENAVVAIAENNKLAFDTTFVTDSGYIFYSGIPDNTGTPSEHVFINLIDSVSFETTPNEYTVSFVPPDVRTRESVYLPLILVDDSTLPSRVIDRFSLESALTQSLRNDYLGCNGYWELYANDEDGIIYARYVIDIIYDAIYISSAGNDDNWGHIPTEPVATFTRAKQILEQQAQGGKTVPYIYVVGNVRVSDTQAWSLEGFDTVVKRYPGATGYSAYSGYMITVPTGGSLTLDDITISGYSKETVQGGSIMYVTGGTVVMNDAATLKENRPAHTSAATSWGGGIYMTAGNYTMNSGSSIVDCTARIGGGLALSGGTFTMNSGSRISDCTAIGYSSTYYGWSGAAYQNAGVFNINDGAYLSGKLSKNNYSDYYYGSVFASNGSAVTNLSVNATLEKVSADNNQSEIYLGTTASKLYITGTPTAEQLASGKFGIDVNVPSSFTRGSTVVQATSGTYSGLFTRGQKIMSYPYALGKGASNNLILAYEGIYVDGINGDDANGGTSIYDAVKTYPVAEQRLVDAVEANPDFTQKIYICGTISVSEAQAWGDIWAAAGHTTPIQSFRLDSKFTTDNAVVKAAANLTLNNIVLNGGRTGTNTTMSGTVPTYMVLVNDGADLTLNGSSGITNAYTAVYANSSDEAQPSIVTMNDTSYISEMTYNSAVAALNAQYVINDEATITGSSSSTYSTVDLLGSNTSLTMNDSSLINSSTVTTAPIVNVAGENASLNISGGQILSNSDTDRAVNFNGGYFGLGGTSAITGWIYLLGDGSVPITLTNTLNNPEGIDSGEFKLLISNGYMFKKVVDGTAEYDATLYHEDDNTEIFFTNYDVSNWMVLEKDAENYDIIAGAKVSHVYIGGTQDVNADGYIGNDANNGKTPFTPVRTWARAMEVLAECGAGANIVVVDKIEIAADETWSLPQRTVGEETYTPIVQRLTTYGGNAGYHMIEVQAGGTLTLENITVDGLKEAFTAESGSIVTVLDGGMLNIEDGAVIRNNFAQNGSGIYVDGAAVMNGGTITANKGVLGFGVYVTQNGEFTLNNGAINENALSLTVNTTETTEYHGAGVFNSGSFTMTGGTVDNNTIYYHNTVYNDTRYGNTGGGGVYNDGTFVATGGSISNNSVQSERYRANWGNAFAYGGGIANIGTGVAEISDVTINGNMAYAYTSYYSYAYGAGIYNSGVLTVNSGAIDNNISGTWSSGYQYSYASGVYNTNEFYFNGGSISNSGKNSSGNNTVHTGGGVYTTKTMVMKGGTIENNTANNGGGIYNSGTFTMYDGTITANKAVSGHGGGAYNTGTLNLYGGKISSNSSTQEGGGVYSASGNITSEKTEYTLNGETLESTGITLCMNTAASLGGGMIYYSGTCNFSAATVCHNKAVGGGGLYACNNTVFNLSGDVLISENTAYDYGGGIAIWNGSGSNTSTIDGNVRIVNNDVYDTKGERRGMGGGIFMGSNSVLTMSSGLIDGNYAYGTLGNGSTGYGGGGVCIGCGTTSYVGRFIMNGGTISNNTTDSVSGGGGVSVTYKGLFTFNGGEIVDNNAVNGGGVLVGSNTSFAMTGGTIDRNTAAGNGGGVYQSATGSYTMTMTGGRIGADNTVGADCDGEAIYIIKNATMRLSGESYILDEVYLQAIDDEVTTSYGATRDAFITVTGDITDGTNYLTVPVDFDNQFEYRIVAKRSDEAVDGHAYFTPVAPWGDLGQHEIANKRFEDRSLWYLRDTRSPKIYINGVSGSDATGDGTYLNPFASLEAAKTKLTLIREAGNEYNGYIYVTGMLSVSQDETWSLENLDATLMRYDGTANGDITQLWGYTGLEYEGNYETGDGTLIKVTNGAKLTLENITINGANDNDRVNDVDAYGSLVYVDEGAELVVSEGAELSFNRRVNGSGGGIYNAGTTTISGGDVTANQTTAGSGGGVFNTGEFVFESGFITANSASSNGGGICMEKGELTIAEGASVSLNRASANGGGVYIPSTGKLAMSGGTLNQNTAANGGGIYTEAVSTTDGEGNITEYGFALTGGTIGSNTASANGGGVYTKSAAYIMTGGSVSANSAGYGAGFYTNDGKALLVGGEILSNISTTHGGGFYLYAGSLELNKGEYTVNGEAVSAQGVTFTTNTAGSSANQYGGGIYLNDGTVVDMYAGTITGCKAVYGGGVYVTQTSKFNMYDGTFSSNSVSSYGGGVYSTGTLNVSGGIVENNSASYGAGVYSITGTFNLVGDALINNNTAVYSGAGVYISSGVFNIDSHTDGEGVITEPTIGFNKTTTTSSTDSYGGAGVYLNNGTMTMNGGTITGNSTYRRGGGIYVRSTAAVLTLNDGLISKNIASSGSGGAMYAYAGTVTMNSGENGRRISFTENTAASHGGAIYIADSGAALTFRIYDVLIQGNKAGYGGGLCCYDSAGKVYVYDGEIVENTAAKYGGGICVMKSTVFEISGGNICRNTATASHGGGIYVHSSGTLAMTGGTLDGNTAKGHGGGIYNYGTISKLENTFVTGNTIQGSTVYGGGIQNSGTISSMKNVTVTDNTVNSTTAYGGGISNTGTLAEISDSTISGNKAEYTRNGYGGGVYTNKGITLTNCAVEDNEAQYGGGVYLHNTTTSAVTGTFNSCDINRNSATADGGGIYVRNTSTGSIAVNAADTDINGNTAGGVGGGIHTVNPLTLNRTNINGNTAVTDGGGIYSTHQLTAQNIVVSGNKAGGMGGGIYTSGSKFDFGNISVYGNSAENGGGLYLNNANASYTLYNDEVFDNTATGKGEAVYVKAGNLILKGSKPLVNGSIYLYEKAYPLTVSSLITNTKRNYTVEVNPSVENGDAFFSYGDPVIRPDGVYVKDVTSYMKNFTLNNMSFVIGRDAPNLVLDACVFVDTQNGSDSNSGFTPDRPLASFAQAKQVLGSNGGVLFVSGTVIVDNEQEWSFDYPRQYIQRYTGFAIGGGAVYDAFLGDMVRVTENGSLTLSGVSVSGRRDYAETVSGITGSVFVVDGGTLHADSTTSIQNNVTSANGGAVRIEGGTAVLNGTSLANTVAVKGSGVYNYSGNLTLTGEVKIEGSVCLDGEGTPGTSGVITVTEPAMTATVPAVDIGDAYAGRPVIVYPDSTQPGDTEKAKWLLDGDVLALYSLNNSSGDTDILELQEKGKIYINGKLGNDSYDGTTPKYAVRTLKKAYELLAEDGGVLIVVDTVTVDTDITLSETSCISGGTQTDVSAGNNVVIRRYSKPQAAETNENYQVDSNVNALFDVTASLTLTDSLIIDGHASAVTSGSETSIAPAVNAQSALITVSGTFTASDKVRLRSNNNTAENGIGGGIRIANGGTAVITDDVSINEVTAAKGAAVYQDGSLVLNGSPDISGEIYLGVNDVINVSAQNLYNFTPKKNLTVNMGDPSDGRDVMTYNNNLVPTASEMLLLELPEDIIATYVIGNDPESRNIIQLNVKTAVYIDGVSGSDTNSGDTPDEAVLSLKKAFTLLSQRGGGTLFVVDTVQIPDMATISADNVTVGGTTINFSVGDTYIIKRYARPDAYESLEGFTHGDNINTLFNVTGSLSLYGVTVDGHNDGVTHSNIEYDRAVGLNAASPLITLSSEGSLNIRDGSVLKNNTNVFNGGAISSAGIIAIRDSSIIMNEAENGGGIYTTGGTVTMFSGTFNENTATNGGGMYIGGTFTQNGGVIADNTAEKGSGIYLDGTYTMNTNASVSTTNDVYLAQDRYITVAQALSTDGVAAVFTPDPYAMYRKVLDYSAVYTAQDDIAADFNRHFALTPHSTYPYYVIQQDTNGVLYLDPFNVDYNLTDTTTTEVETIERYTDLVVEFEVGELYDFPAELRIIVTDELSGEEVEITAQQYEYDAQTGILTVPYEFITGDILVEATAFYKRFDVVTVLKKLDFEGEQKAVAASDYTAVLSLGAPGYTMPETIEVKVGEAVLTSGTDYTYESATGEIRIFSEHIIDTVTISADAIPNIYNVTNTLTKLTSDGEATATCGTDYTATLTADRGYSLPESIVISVGGTELTEDADYTYDSDTGEIVLLGDGIIGDVVITADAVANTYNVTNTLTRLTSDGEDTATCGTDYTATLTADRGYSVPDAITITVGDETAELGTDYTYDSDTGTIVILGDIIFGDIEIEADAIPNVYNVTAELYKLLTDGEDTATHGTDYTAVLTPLNSGFNLPETVEITIGGETAVLGTDYTYNRTTGTIVIAGNIIFGDIVIKADAVPNVYTVTAEVVSITYTGEASATAGIDYTAVMRAFAGFSMPDTINVTIGGETALVGTDYTYDSADGSVTVTGDSITGNIVISAQGIIRENAVTANTENLSFAGDDTVLTGHGYMATLTADEHYSLPEQIEIKVGYETLRVDEDYTYNAQTGEISIEGACIVHDVTITAAGVADSFPVVETFTKLTSDGADTATYGINYTAELTADRGYSLPESIVITVGGVELTDYTYDKTTGAIVINGDSIIGDIEIKADGVPNTYNVTESFTKLDSDGADTATCGTSYTATLTADAGYSLPEAITITIGGETAVLDTDYTYDKSTGAIVILGDIIFGDIEITADAVPNVYNVMNTLTKLTGDGEATATCGTDYTQTLTADRGYSLPESIVITVGGVELTDYTYDKTTGAVVINGDVIIGDVEIKADGDIIVLDITNDLTYVTTSNSDTQIEYGTEYTSTLIADTGYTLPETVTVTLDGEELTEGVSYNAQTGELTVAGDKVTGDLVITATGNIIVFDVTKELENVRSDNEDLDIEYGNTYTTVIEPDYGYELPDEVVISIGDTVITDGYTYDKDTGELTIEGSKVIGDIIINADGRLKVYTVSTVLTNIAYTGELSVSHATAYTATLTANEGYQLTDTVTVTISGTALTSEQYTYDSETGVITVPDGLITGDVVITAKAHKLKTVTTPATCTEDGLTVISCEDCGEIISETVHAKLGHDLGEWYTYTAASCCYDGEERRDCSRCDYYESRVTQKTGEHIFGEWYTTVEPTCCDEGTQRHDCQIGPYFETRTVAATGHHVLGEWTVEKEATCCYEGEERRYCETGGYYESRTIPATGEHTMGDWYVTTAPTCSEEGEQRSDCKFGPYFETRKIPATDEHTFSGGRCTHCSVAQYYHIVLNKPSNFRYKINGRTYIHYEVLEVEYGTDLVIEIQMGTMYDQSNYYFTANGQHYNKTEDNRYVIEHVDQDMLIVVAGVMKNKTSSILEYLKMFFMMLMEIFTHETVYSD